MARDREVPITHSGALTLPQLRGEELMPKQYEIIFMCHKDRHYSGRVTDLDPKKGAFRVWLTRPLPNGHQDVVLDARDHELTWYTEKEIVHKVRPLDHRCPAPTIEEIENAARRREA